MEFNGRVFREIPAEQSSRAEFVSPMMSFFGSASIWGITFFQCGSHEINRGACLFPRVQ